MPDIVEINYGKIVLKGEEVFGKICLSSSCGDVEFLYLVEESTQVFDDSISGLVGLGRPRDFALAPDQEVDKHKLFMEAVTDTTKFTFSFNSLQGLPGSGQSEVSLEGAPSVRVNDDFFWSVHTTGVRFGPAAQNAFSFPDDPFYETGGKDGVYTILDTGASAIYISELWYGSFMSEL